MAATPHLGRTDRLDLLRAEAKGLADPAVETLLNQMLADLSDQQVRYLTKNPVLDRFRVLMKACRRASDEDKRRVCDWLEKVLEIQGLDTSDGLLDRWLDGLPL